MKNLKTAFIPLLGLLCSNCSTLVYTRKPETRVFTQPLHQETANFFVFSLLGSEKHFYAHKICTDKQLDQVTLEYTGEDILTAFFTFGLYTPRTVKFWCSL